MNRQNTVLQCPISRECDVTVTFVGTISSEAIARLIQYLEIMRGSQATDERVQTDLEQNER